MTWVNWTSGSTTAQVCYVIPVQSTTSTATWEIWQGTSSTTSTNATVVSWEVWNTHQQVRATGVDLGALAERREAQRIRGNEFQRIRQAAVKRAELLLRQHLSEDQIEELDRAGRFTVQAPSGNQYCILRGYQGNVRRGQFRYCCHGPSNIPVPDQMLMQKLAIETDEAGFLAIANRSH